MKKMISIVVVLSAIVAFGTVQAAPMCWENWEDGGDPDWCTWGSPSPIVYPIDGNMVMDPNGDGWCPSGYFACNSMASWVDGSCFSLDFQTNVNGGARAAHYQFIELGLGTGWVTTGDCANDLVQAGIRMYISTEGALGQEITLHQSGFGLLWSMPYPASEDGIWHHLEVCISDGGTFGMLDVTLDGVSASAALGAVLPGSMGFFVGGRSVGITNAVDNISFECGSDPVASENTSWGNVKSIFR